VESSGLLTVPLGFEMTWGIKVGTPDGAAVALIPGARLSDDCVMSVVGSHMLVSVFVAVGVTVITRSVDEAAAEEVIVADPMSELVVGRVPLRAPDVETTAVVVGAELSVVRVALPEAELAVVEMTVPLPVVVGALPPLVVGALPEVVVVSVPLDDVVSILVGAALLSVVGVVLPAAVLVVGVVVGAAVSDKSLVTDPRRLDKILPSPVLSVVVVEVAAADEADVVVKTPVEAAPLIPEVVVVGSKDPTKDESKDESSSGVVLVAAAEADVVVASEVVVAGSEVVVAASEVVVAASEVVVAAAEVVVAAAEVVGTITLDMSDTRELSKLLGRSGALVVVDVVVLVLDAAVDPPVPENDTPDVVLESEVVVGGAGSSVVLELVLKTPPGPKVIPPFDDAAAEVVVGTKALVSVVDDVGAIITEGSNPVDPIRASLVVVGGNGVGSNPTTVVC
jgi:hypothetical protein